MSLYLTVELNDNIKKQLTLKQNILKQNNISGDYEDSTRFHITLRFLSEDSVDNGKVMDAMKNFEEIYQPKLFNVVAKNFGKFPQGVIWVGVNDYLPLNAIKYQIEDCLIKAGFPLQPDTHKGYVPHITMVYDSNDDVNLNFGEGITIPVDNISLWAGFKANDTYIHNKLYGLNLK